MHEIQARVLGTILNYIQDKVGKEPDLLECCENSAGEIEIRLAFTIRRNYPGIGTKKAEKP
jgi:hypothetical protein